MLFIFNVQNCVPEKMKKLNSNFKLRTILWAKHQQKIGPRSPRCFSDQDLRLSPTKPGFNSRLGKLYFFLRNHNTNKKLTLQNLEFCTMQLPSELIQFQLTIYLCCPRCSSGNDLWLSPTRPELNSTSGQTFHGKSISQNKNLIKQNKYLYDSNSFRVDSISLDNLPLLS